MSRKISLVEQMARRDVLQCFASLGVKPDPSTQKFLETLFISSHLTCYNQGMIEGLERAKEIYSDLIKKEA